jgi:hypothetical protein
MQRNKTGKFGVCGSALAGGGSGFPLKNAA